jgi:triacylglycerol lipase
MAGNDRFSAGPEATMERRTHLVLVPGFAGFDALGQLHYYADLTPLLRRWADADATESTAVHYFDNLPTAGVSTRAKRLRDWIAKRIARREFQGDDSVALIGHSTGGLDIRQLVRELALDPSKRIPVDGAEPAACRVTGRDVLQCVNRLVFLSVPQRGTNIADFVGSYPKIRMTCVAALLAAVAGRDMPGVEWLEALISAELPELAGAELLFAVKDAFTEMTSRKTDAPRRVADAQEARAEVELWLRHMWKDFSAIEDLASMPPPGPADSEPSKTPARFDDVVRQQEIEAWQEHHILTRSYATVGRRPFDFAPATRLEPWNPASRDALRELKDAARRETKMDFAYLVAYRACAGGPFGGSASASPGTAGPAAKATEFAGGRKRDIEVWDNDGIVNTASMLWPEGEPTRLVDGDHGDIIGHFHEVKAVQPAPRTYHTYDLLGSDSGFGQAQFEAVWRDVYEFCTR